VASLAALLQQEGSDLSLPCRFIIASDLEFRRPKCGKRKRKNTAEILWDKVLSGASLTDEELQSSGLLVCRSLEEAETLAEQAAEAVYSSRRCGVAWSARQVSDQNIMIYLWRDP
jgi:hypothetical protein